jgi:predicted MFS family arabinose efflux permease
MSLDVTPAEQMLASGKPPESPPLSKVALWVMAAACGAGAANIYYNQPLLGDFAKYFKATPQQAGLVATAAQVGYGVGLFFFVPLGDLVERRKIVLGLVSACVALLIATAASPTLCFLVAAQLLVGVTAMCAQLLIPLAVDLSPPAERGRTVGVLMAGLLVGILLARTLAGFVGDTLGWRAMYFLAALIMLAIAFVLRATLPHRPPTLKMSYGRLLHSMIELGRTHPPLWKSAAVSGLSFGSFVAFWTALSFLMAAKFGRGASEAGLFGVVGVIGALCAPLAGRLSDRRGPGFTVTLALGMSAAAFGLMWGWVTIPALIVGVLLMDVGVQSIQVAEQSAVMALVPEARSRMNTLYMVTRFMGGAAGSALAASAWARYGWNGVSAICVALQGVALIVHFIAPRPKASRAPGVAA